MLYARQFASRGGRNLPLAAVGWVPRTGRSAVPKYRMPHILRAFQTDSGGVKGLQKLFSDLSHGGPSAHTEQDLLQGFLKHMPGTAKEVSRFLRLFSGAEAHKFAVIKVGGAVVEENMDELVRQLSFLHRVGLYPTVVHGGGPQLNEALEAAGIKHEFRDGLRVSTEEVMRHALPVFERQNTALVDALEKAGVRARPIMGGVFEAELLDGSKYGLVGRVVRAKTDHIKRSIRAHALPIVASVGLTPSGTTLNINADVAASQLAGALQPLKIVYLNSSGGLLDEQGEVIPLISMQEDYDRYMSQPWFKHGARLKLREIHDMLEVLPEASTVAIAKPGELLKELFTYSGAGTLFKRGTSVRVLSGEEFAEDLDEDKLGHLINSAFGRRLVPGYFAELKEENKRSPASVRVYHTPAFDAAAVIRTLPGSNVPYMDKFVTHPGTQGLGLGETVLSRVFKDNPTMVWRSHPANPVNAFYQQQCDGTFASGDWRVFWVGDLSVEQVTPLVQAVLARAPTLLPASPPPPTQKSSSPESSRPADKPKRRVGIIGARGYTGNEMMKLILTHPGMELAAVSSRQLVGRRISSHLKEFYPGGDGATDLDLRYTLIDPEQIGDFTSNEHVDAWVLALPNGLSKPYVTALSASYPAVPIVDLSADHRFEEEWVYGSPERHRAALAGATRIANPGCYATAAQLALLPYVPLLDPSSPPVCFGVSGYSGAGTNPSDKNDVDTLRDNIIPYSLTGHLHESEVSDQLQTPIRFVPHVASFFQGIQVTTSMRLRSPISSEQALQLCETQYAGEALVRVQSDPPRVRDNARRHHVAIGGFAVGADGRTLTVCSTIDNLLKGAATQALQNLNLALGEEELAGIRPHLDAPPTSTLPAYEKWKPRLSTAEAKELDKKYVVGTYGERQALLHRGSNARVYNDTEGKEYIDLVAGIAVNALGHADPAWATAVSRQAQQRLTHTSNLYYTEEQIALAKALVEATPWASQAFFGNSGTEAIEGALKFARKRGRQLAESKTKVLAFTNGFHGRTGGALSITYKAAYREPFGPLVDFGSTWVGLNDAAGLEAAMDDNVCAVVLEPIQGEGGIREATSAFAQRTQELCRQHDALFIVDEIQCGLGRTGRLWAHESLLDPSECPPDVMTLAKPLAGGLPAAAILCAPRACEHMLPGEHGTTFGGSPMACSTALHVFERIRNPDFLASVVGIGEYLKEQAARLPLVSDVRGRGLMLGIDIDTPHTAAEVMRRCRDAGLLVGSAGERTLRIVPPLTLTWDDAEQAMAILHTALHELEQDDES